MGLFCIKETFCLQVLKFSWPAYYLNTGMNWQTLCQLFQTLMVASDCGAETTTVGHGLTARVNTFTADSNF